MYAWQVVAWRSTGGLRNGAQSSGLRERMLFRPVFYGRYLRPKLWRRFLQLSLSRWRRMLFWRSLLLLMDRERRIESSSPFSGGPFGTPGGKGLRSARKHEKSSHRLPLNSVGIDSSGSPGQWFLRRRRISSRRNLPLRYKISHRPWNRCIGDISWCPPIEIEQTPSLFIRSISAWLELLWAILMKSN